MRDPWEKQMGGDYFSTEGTMIVTAAQKWSSHQDGWLRCSELGKSQAMRLRPWTSVLIYLSCFVIMVRIILVRKN